MVGDVVSRVLCQPSQAVGESKGKLEAIEVDVNRLCRVMQCWRTTYLAPLAGLLARGTAEMLDLPA